VERHHAHARAADHRLRARQNDATNVGADGAPIERGNHDGGKIVFGRDGKLYVEVGDVGRRGQMQNLPDGPGCVVLPCPEPPTGGLADDQYGGPEPDDAHLTGVVLRLNDDGTTPRDNPFVRAGRERGGEVGENLAKVFSYGVRNAFGLAVDPLSGALWDAQNGDDAFSEINRIPAGANLGWIQAMGPLSRNGQYKAIETDRTTRDPITNQLGYFGLQQTRYSPEPPCGRPREAWPGCTT
jgi:glucose/arabinose dehydrogenase